MRLINEAIVHASATRPEWLDTASIEAKYKEIDHWHRVDNGWRRGFGYHFLIDRNGAVKEGRPLEWTGAHVRGRNANSIGICLVGGFGSAKTDDFYQHFTAAQDVALRDLLTQLQAEIPTLKKISGHNEYANKACPGFNVSRWLAGKTPERESLRESGTVQGAAAALVATVAGVSEDAKQLIGDFTETFGVEPKWVLLAVAVAGLFWVFRERAKKWWAGDR